MSSSQRINHDHHDDGDEREPLTTPILSSTSTSSPRRITFFQFLFIDPYNNEILKLGPMDYEGEVYPLKHPELIYHTF